MGSLESEERINLLADIADMYYIQELTQDMIARKTGYSRSAISRFLSEAKDKGIIEFWINYPIQRDMLLERKIKNIFQINDVYVVRNGESSYLQILRKLGKVASAYVEKRLPGIKRIGISWGTATYETFNSLSHQYLPDLEVVQMIGAVGEGNPKIDGTELVHSFAEKLSAKSRFLHAPLIADSIETAKILKNERKIREVISLSLDMEMAIVGIGTLDLQYSSLRRAGYMVDEDIQKIVDQGAVGDICVNHYDQFGTILDIEINKRVIGIDMRLLSKSKCKIIGVAAGKHKALPILGALRGNLVNVLVTDCEAANHLISLNQKNVEENKNI